MSGTRDAQRQRMDFDAISSEEYYPFGRSGGGAPLKTSSGKLQTSLKADPNIRFQSQLMKEVNDTLVSMIVTLLLYSFVFEFLSKNIFMQRYKPDGMELGEPYYAPKEEPLHAKDSAQLRKIEERDKQMKYAKKLGESMKSDNRKVPLCITIKVYKSI